MNRRTGTAFIALLRSPVVTAVMTACVLLYIAAGEVHAGRLVRVGAEQNLPLAAVNSQGRGEGIIFDVLRHTASREDWDLEYVSCPLSQCFDLLEDGKLDLVGGIAYSRERAERLDFNSQSVVSGWGHIYVQPGIQLESFLDLRNRRLAVVRNDIHQRAIEEMLRRFDIPVTYVEQPYYSDVFTALDRHEVDAGVVSRFFAQKHERDHHVRATPLIFNPVELRFATARGRNASLLAAIDRDIADLKRDPTSPYFNWLNKWLGGAGNSGIPQWVWIVSVSVVALLVTALGASAVFRIQVRNRTRALEAEIAERRKAEDALRTSENTLRSIIETTTEGFWLIDPVSKRTVDVNSALCAMLGYGRDEIVGRTPAEFADQQNRKIFQVQTDQIAATDHRGYDIVLTAKSGDQVPTHFSASTIRDAQGKPVLAFAFISDLRERIATEQEHSRLEQQLHQAQKLESVGRLAGGIAHDFNNLLTPIIGYAEMLMLGAGNDARMRKRLDDILAAALRARELTQQLLAFSRKQPLDMAVVDLGTVIDSFLPILQRAVGENVVITRHKSTGLWKVRGDTAKIGQIIMNLSVNARDAMPGGGAISIDLCNITRGVAVEEARDIPPGDYVVLKVSDTGSGIEPDILPHVFEPFFTTKLPGKGTGLGLATVYGIVKQHGGHIWLDSTPGQGTTFTILLPRSKDEAVSADRPPAATKGGVCGQGVLLLVEDDSMVRELARNILSEHGYTVHAADGPGEARRIFDELGGEIDLLVTDIVMPGMNGTELYESLRQTKPGLAALFMTGYPGEALASHGIASETLHILAKPFSVHTLTSAVCDRIRGVR